MKNRVALLVLLLVSLSTIVFGQNAQRIRFRRGAISANVVSILNGFNDQKLFVIKVRAGQKLTVSANREVTLTIADPAGGDASDMDASCNSRKIVEPTVAGDYRITAIECRKAEPWRRRFTLKITVK